MTDIAILSGTKITRVEVIDGAKGRVYVNNSTKLMYAQLQDDGKTLKLFLVPSLKEK